MFWMDKNKFTEPQLKFIALVKEQHSQRDSILDMFDCIIKELAKLDPQKNNQAIDEIAKKINNLGNYCNQFDKRLEKLEKCIYELARS